MAKIQSEIVLQDNFSPVLQNIAGFINLAMGSMRDLQETVSRPFEPAALQGMQEYVSKTNLEMRRLMDNLENLAMPELAAPSTPWQWQSDSLPVFIDSGLARFEQEAERTNRQLANLYQSQMQIANQAAQTNIFSANAGGDLQEMANRINAVRLQVENMAANPAGLGLNAANSELERMRAQLVQAAQEQALLNNAVAGMDVQAANEAYLRLSQTISNTERQIRDSLNLEWHWQTDEMPVFTDSGLARFRQELASANSSLNSLYNTQAQVAAAASNIDWLPDNALADLGNMQNRLQGIWQQVNLIGSNPLNFGSDFANQELERMRGQLALAVQEQERLNAAVAGMNVQAANAAYLQLSQTVSGLEQYIRDNTNEQGLFNQTIQQGAQNAFGLGNMLSGVVKAYLGLAGLRKAIDFGQDSMRAFDVQMNAQVQLGTVVSNMGMADYYDDIVAQAAAIQSQGMFGDEIMIAGAAELATYFTDGDAVLSIMNTLTDYASGMSGGAELNAQQMTDYATGLGKVMTGSYEAMTKKGFEFNKTQKAIIEGTASHAQIAEQLGAEYLEMSSDMQAAAAINQVIAESWGGMYEAMSNTPHGQIVQLTNAWGDLQEQIGQGLYPYVLLVVGAFRDNWPTVQGFVQGIASGFNTILGVLSWVTKAGLGFADMVMNNWSWISPLIYGAAIALGFYKTILAATNISQGINNGLTAFSTFCINANWAALNMQTGATFAATAAQYGFNAALWACPLTWIVVKVMAVVAVFYAGVAAVNHFVGTTLSATGLICGAVAAAGAFIGNTFVGLISGIIQFLWSGFVAPFMGIIEWVLNACNGGFDSLAGAVTNLLGQLLSVVLSFAKSVTNILDSVFGWNLTDKLQGWQSEVSSWGKNKNAITFAAEMDPANYLSKFHIDYTDTFNAGYGFGENLFKNPFGLQNIDLPTYDLLNNSVWDNMDNSLREIVANTGDMAHELNMSDEDLKWMRDIAEREAVNRYTTAEIVVNMGGITNQVNKMEDLDGITTKLVDNMIQQIEIGAEGVHI